MTLPRQLTSRKILRGEELMPGPPLVSIVIPAYNHEKYLKRCLTSVDRQTYEPLEIIIVDDGSKDDSWAVINSFEWSLGRMVKMHRTPNRGAHNAINMALHEATGKYVNILNSDDYFATDRIEKMVHSAKGEEFFFGFSRVVYVNDEEQDISNIWDFAIQLRKTQDAIGAFPSVGFALLPTNVSISTGNFFFSRALTEKIGYFRPYRYCHDWDFILRALSVVEPTYIDDPLYFYRLHATNSFRSLQQAAEFECPELMRRYFKASYTKSFINKQAPTARNWPVFFDFFIEQYAYQPYMLEWSGIDGLYYPGETHPTNNAEKSTPIE